MQDSRHTLKPDKIGIEDIDTEIKAGEVYIYCQRKGCGKWKYMAEAHPVTNKEKTPKWIGVRVFEGRNPTTGQTSLKTKDKHDKIAKYYCSKNCAVAGEL